MSWTKEVPPPSLAAARYSMIPELAAWNRNRQGFDQTCDLCGVSVWQQWQVTEKACSQSPPFVLLFAATQWQTCEGKLLTRAGMEEVQVRSRGARLLRGEHWIYSHGSRTLFC
ncbi:hypothetical protein SADUNF_Sadunf06G0181000 [Salix dunnii]|uniref:Uncharacterized protein n=1 Tax=Salix dunnii TaxID=1413687 RepID=A0A835N379_9ROSI|nr:hypothetical protein SADUNF_Sadunf06G0181000 [Salix dunnii]